jgi:hypothetical protein
MSDGQWEAQVAVFEALSSASPTIAGGRIHAPAPEGYASFPYVDIGESDALPVDTSGSDQPVREGSDLRLMVHVWSRQDGQKEVKQIASQVRAALHDRPLSIAGKSGVLALIRSVRVFRDDDGKTWHGVVECRILYHA